jgi:mannose-6-phosphate isomerase-like protein (cupin superfamily)
MTVPNLDRVSDDWRARGFSCGVWTDPPGRVWADFVHAVDELVLPVEGEIEIEMQGRRLRLAVGEEVLIPAGVPHTVRNPGNSQNRWCYGYRQTRPDPSRL